MYSVAYRANGKQVRETIGPNKRMAESILAQRVAEIVVGDYVEIAAISFDEFAEKWLNEHAKPRLKGRTYEVYLNMINKHLRPAFAGCSVSKIKPARIRSYLCGLSSSKSPKTLNNLLVLMKTMFNHAQKWGYLKNNPAADVEKFKQEHMEMDFLNPSEVNLLLKHAQEPYRTLIMTAILTGMRRAEILALTWGDIDWNSNSIFVRRSLYWVNKATDDVKWKFVSPKSRASKRVITMSPALKKALEIHKIVSPINEHDLVFANRKGNPVSPDHMVKRYFHTALRLAGLRQIRFHDLRHSYCSLLISQGENVKFIQSQLGHSSITTTLDRYGHLLPVDHVGVGTRLDSQIFQEFAKPAKTSYEIERITGNTPSL
ncbi:MAG: site-specific integrase [Candidatus Omnitrophica bacterium]|nr:site-specific integrase [Candidatus Omnitrophota bacterium]